jgi:hypothetical protein
MKTSGKGSQSKAGMERRSGKIPSRFGNEFLTPHLIFQPAPADERFSKTKEFK